EAPPPPAAARTGDATAGPGAETSGVAAGMAVATDVCPAGARGGLGTAELVAVHALTWLVAGNAVGLLLATLLLAPELHGLLGPLSFGRWMPVHWNAQLYGWLALPLVGLLLRWYRSGHRAASLAIAAWSATLAAGCASWLAGGTSGKPFLEWAGPARWLLVGNLTFLSGVLLVGLARRPAGKGRAGLAARAGLLAALLAVPALMARATDPAVYPPVNPASGGPTGGSLLGSTLGIVAFFLAAPSILGLTASPGLPGRRRRLGTAWAVLGLHGLLFLLLDHGDHSHHEALQVAAVASLAIWPPLLVRHLRAFRWPAGSGPWLAALAGWGVLLVVSAVVTFLPGVLERWKFTNALVAHAHLAMGGLATSFAVLVLLALTAGGRLEAVLAGRRPFALWHGGCLLYVAAMLVLGTLEGGDPGVVIRGDAAGTLLYAVRWAAGAAMLAASGEWLGRSLGRLLAARPAGDRTAAGPPDAGPRAAWVSGGGR
ncbi:MAG TPA: hypothetical protein VF150_11175, partial [Thermoanaerobaculia bacterium]